MALEIVWRNPNPRAKNREANGTNCGDDLCALYTVTVADKTATFKVILSRAARKA